MVTIVSILAALAQPGLHRALVKARAADVLGTLDVVRVGVLNYQAEHSAWPPDRNRGQIPPGLEEYLPEGFTFRSQDYLLDYDNWSGMGNSRFSVGLTYITSDVELGQAVLEMLGSNAWTDGGTKFTWIIQS